MILILKVFLISNNDIFCPNVGQIRLEVDGFIKPFTFSRYFLKFKLNSYFIYLIGNLYFSKNLAKK